MPSLLKLGSVGPDVAKWKGLLAAAGFPAGEGDVFDETARDQTKAWQASRGIGADGVVGDQSWSTMLGTAVSSGGEDKHAKFGRDTLLAVWKDVTGEEPALPVLQIAGATARLESNYGLSSYTNHDTGEKSGVINNWGAVQGQPGFLASDTHADGSAYVAHYRIYATPEEGAADMVKQMTVRRPTAWAFMKAGDIDATMQAMRHQDPVTKVGGYFEQDPVQRAGTIDKYVRAIASTLGEPVAAVRGGPAPSADASAASSFESSAAALSAAPKALGIGAALAAAATLAYHYFTGKWPW